MPKAGFSCRFLLATIITIGTLFPFDGHAGPYWQCGVAANHDIAKSVQSDQADRNWHEISQIDIHRVDQLTASDLPDVTFRLADVEFVPEYQDLALNWLQTASRESDKALLLLDGPDFLGRRPVWITSRPTDGLGGDNRVPWSQRLLLAGLVMALPQTGSDVGSLMDAEDTAIRQRAGIWSIRDARHAYFVAANADVDDAQPSGIPSVEDAIGRFVVVDGVVRSVEHQEWRSYLNFGGDWRSDFTIALDDAVRHSIAGGDNFEKVMDRWSGRKVRVRGIIESRGGPYVSLENPDWLCVQPE
ncbi:hypothetical protein [Thalassospira povalilytica]|uniref:hypothetical protein n=1 Tax=Thalassospira povalilytica TaxID=732237 RepID=UPI003AA88AFA